MTEAPAAAAALSGTIETFDGRRGVPIDQSAPRLASTAQGLSRGSTGASSIMEPQADPWLVLQTKTRHEDVVADALRQRHITSYLPKQKVVRFWQGRKRSSEIPLFPGYIFVRPRADQYEGMRYVRGSRGLIPGAGNKPATLPVQDVKAVMMLVDSGTSILVDTGLLSGTRVKVIAGPLAGVEGQLVRVKNRDLLVINVELVNSSVRVEVDRHSITLV